MKQSGDRQVASREGLLSIEESQTFNLHFLLSLKLILVLDSTQSSPIVTAKAIIIIITILTILLADRMSRVLIN